MPPSSGTPSAPGGRSVVRGRELIYKKKSYRPPGQRRRNKPPERPAIGTEVGRGDRPLRKAL